MGTIQFHTEHPGLLSETGIARADFVTFDGRVIPSSTTLKGGLLTCDRAQMESSRLRILCQVSPTEQFVAQTTCLRETPVPYQLEVELARGELSRLRNHYGLWTGAGLRSSPEVDTTRDMAHRTFRNAVVAPGSLDSAIRALRLAHHATDQLCELYTRQRLAFRRQRSTQFPVFLGCRLSEIPARPELYMDAFNAVLVNTDWSRMEPSDGDYQWTQTDALVDWATTNRLFLMGGPLVDLSRNRFPNWMQCWHGDPVNMQSFTADFVETVVGHYVGRIRHWEVICGANRGGACGLTEEQRLNLALQAIGAARQVDEQIQISLRVVQPWGEYISTTQNRLPPIQFVDTLRRSGVSIDEVSLEIRCGQDDLASLPRDLLSFSQLLDHWSMLQVPLNVMVALPELVDSDGSSVSEPQFEVQQAQWLENVLLMCLSKERVTGVYCFDWDAASQDHATSSLLQRPDGSVHPAYERLKDLEQRYWPEQAGL
ncbi:MAG: endo-1,4-beta-xylanase [Planctomycetaceae bacterium]